MPGYMEPIYYRGKFLGVWTGGEEVPVEPYARKWFTDEEWEYLEGLREDHENADVQAERGDEPVGRVAGRGKPRKVSSTEDVVDESVAGD